MTTYYMHPISGACRSVWMAIEAVGLNVEIVTMDLMKGQQNEQWFLDINPRHCVPTLVDDGFIMCESRAIMRYLVNKFGKDDSLYPKDVQQRFLVDMALDTDLSLIYKAVAAYVYPKMFHGKEPDEEATKGVEKVLCHVNDVMLEKFKFVAGEKMTIGDISLFCTLSTLKLVGFKMEQFSKYAKVHDLITSMQSLSYYDKCNSAFDKMVIEKNA